MGQSFECFIMLNKETTEELIWCVFEYFSKKGYFEEIFDSNTRKHKVAPLTKERVKEFMKGGTKHSISFVNNYSISMMYSEKMLTFFSADAVLCRDWEPTPQRAKLWTETRELLVGLVKYLGQNVDIAFSDLENSALNVHLRFEKGTPSEDDVSYLCSALWLLFISKKRVQKIGREFLIKTPAWKVTETENGLFIINGPSPLVTFPEVQYTRGEVDDYFATYLKKIKYPGKWYDSRGNTHSYDN